jgi:hypothetical protein
VKGVRENFFVIAMSAMRRGGATLRYGRNCRISGDGKTDVSVVNRL